tara:strand:+ start:9886 stop:10131 length:246 start_codon:yes stop_codon:yes gene_type:complete
MALYSWFTWTNTKPNNNKINNEILKASQSVQYIENYTMWPTAKIKPNAQLTPPNYSNLDDSSVKHQQAILPTKTALTVIKS